MIPSSVVYIGYSIHYLCKMSTLIFMIQGLIIVIMFEERWMGRVGAGIMRPKRRAVAA